MIRFYDNPQQLRQLKLDGKSRGESTIHLDFVDRQGNRTNGKSGRLTTEIKPPGPDRVIKTHDELLLLFYKKEILYEDLLDLLVMEHLTDHASKWTRFKGMFNP